MFLKNIINFIGRPSHSVPYVPDNHHSYSAGLQSKVSKGIARNNYSDFLKKLWHEVVAKIPCC